MTAATEADGQTLHREFCQFLLERLRATDENKQPLCSPAWGAVIRAFLKDNDITMPPSDSTPLGQLAAEFRGARPPRVFDPELDGPVN